MIVSDSVMWQCAVTNRRLNSGHTSALDMLKPASVVVVSQAENEQVNKDLARIQALLKKGKIKKACQVNTRLVEVDPDTNSLKFPNQCVEFFHSVLSLPPDQFEKLNPAKTGATESEKKARMQNTLNEILQFIMTYIPDDKRKMALLNQAKRNFKLDGLLELLNKENAIGNFPFQNPKKVNSNELDVLIDFQSSKPIANYRLARLLINEGDIERAIEIGKTFESPPLVFGFLYLLLNCQKLTPDQEKVFLNLASKLPNPFKHLLITHANLRNKHHLAKEMELNFDRKLFKSEAEKGYRIIFNDQIIHKVMNRDLSEADIYNVCLIYRMAPSNRGEYKYEKTNHDVWGCRIHSMLFNKGMKKLSIAIRSFEDVMPIRKGSDLTTIVDRCKKDEWPIPLIVLYMEELRDERRDRDNKLKFELQRLLPYSFQHTRETLTQQMMELAIPVKDNIFIPPKERDEINRNELLCLRYVLEGIKNGGYNEAELMVTGMQWRPNGNEIFPEIPINEGAELFTPYENRLQHWSLRGFDVLSVKSYLDEQSI